ncbi:uncharacterized protein LOC112973116 [Apteryx rowi]|uniref:uncharacterized protein LOC112973116 n=1 Tax=Apteryx rowi TaxID=308060 RepID=UPI000E1C8454|nr:uncharacterized protein LOC112973116 [Apteryx rowi]
MADCENPAGARRSGAGSTTPLLSTFVHWKSESLEMSQHQDDLPGRAEMRLNPWLDLTAVLHWTCASLCEWTQSSPSPLDVTLNADQNPGNISQRNKYAFGKKNDSPEACPDLPLPALLLPAPTLPARHTGRGAESSHLPDHCPCLKELFHLPQTQVRQKPKLEAPSLGWTRYSPEEFHHHLLRKLMQSFLCRKKQIISMVTPGPGLASQLLRLGPQLVSIRAEPFLQLLPRDI